MTHPPPRRALAAAAALLAATGCAAINRQVDHWALQQKADRVLGQSLASAPGADLPFRSSEELERLTRPEGLPEVAVAQLERAHRQAVRRVVQEELRFTSAIALRFPEAAQAKAYVFRHGELGERPVLLFVPGQNLTEKDYGALSGFFAQALERDMDVVFFVPPYHLDRTPRGYGSGEALLATDFVDHLQAFAQELGDLRALAAWLRSRGVRDLGAFGGSMGGTLVLKLVGWEPIFDFVIALQPVVDWNAVLARPEMAPVRARLREQGVGDEDVRLAYEALDPRAAAQPRLASQRISLMYGRYDLIAGAEPLLSLAGRWGVTRVRAYDRGHALVTLGGRPERDLGLSLEADLKAMRWRRQILGRLGR